MGKKTESTCVRRGSRELSPTLNDFGMESERSLSDLDSTPEELLLLPPLHKFPFHIYSYIHQGGAQAGLWIAPLRGAIRAAQGAAGRGATGLLQTWATS